MLKHPQNVRCTRMISGRTLSGRASCSGSWLTPALAQMQQ